MIPLWTTENCHDGSDLGKRSVNGLSKFREEHLPMRVTIQTRGLPMCSPSSVCNASVRIENLGQIWVLLFDKLLELGDLANLFESENFILFITINS